MMSEFHELGDEFAGDEANEEWDAAWAAYSAGDQPDVTAHRMPLRTVLHLPIGLVEIRGDDPGVELCLLGQSQSSKVVDDEFALADVEGECLDGNDDSVALTFELTEHSDGRISYTALERGGGEVSIGEISDPESAMDLLARILDATITADTLNVYLSAACVELDGRGVLVLASDSAERDAVCRGLLDAGAKYLSDSLVVLKPGTRVVSGVARRRFDIADERVIGCAVVDEVLIVDGVERASQSFENSSIGLIGATEEVIGFIHPLSRDNPLAIPYLALLLSHLNGNVRYVSTEEIAAGQVAAELVAFSERPKPDPDDLPNTTLFTLSELPSTVAHQRWLLSAEDGDFVTGGGEPERRLEPEEASSLATEMRQAAGRRLSPSALGLPGCPPIRSLGEIWSSTNAESLASSLPAGLIRELVARNLVSTDDTEAARSQVNEAAEQSLRRSRSTIRLLREILDSWAGEGSRHDPIVLGEVVDAVEGKLPAGFVDVVRLEFLVDLEETDPFVSSLERIGLVRESLTMSSRSLEVGTGVSLSTAGDDPIEVEVCRTLATGPFGLLVDPDEFHTLAVPARIGGRWVRVLHPDHRFIHACLRYARAGAGDIALARSVVINAPRLPALTARMLDRAERLGAVRNVLAVVTEVDSLLPGIPAHMAEIATGRTTRPKRSRRIGRRG